MKEGGSWDSGSNQTSQAETYKNLQGPSQSKEQKATDERRCFDQLTCEEISLACLATHNLHKELQDYSFHWSLSMLVWWDF